MLDDAALACFVRVGFLVGEDTPGRVIRGFRPAPGPSGVRGASTSARTAAPRALGAQPRRGDLLARHYPSFAHLPIDAKRPGREDPRRIRRDALGLVRAIAETPSALIARGAVAARAARALATGRSAQLWFLPKVMHLLDVERAADTTRT